MANPLNQADLQDALIAHDHLKWFNNLPLFHRDESKETTTRSRLIDKIKVAAEIATWDDRHKV